MFFVSNLPSSSQAGRRRFDPGLPLQNINNLAEATKSVTPSHSIRQPSLQIPVS